MAYASVNQPQRNLPTLAAVAVLHVGIGLALINGLAGPIFLPEPDQPLEGYQIDNRNQPEPTPTPQPQPSALPTSSTAPQSDADDQPVDAEPNPYATGGPVTPPSSGSGEKTETVPPIVIPTTPPAFVRRGAVPRGDPGSWVSTLDYPRRDQIEGHEGISRVKLTIGANGRVTGCELIRSSGWPALDAATCTKLTSRARFEPATDETGTKVSGSFATSVRWQIPAE